MAVEATAGMIGLVIFFMFLWLTLMALSILALIFWIFMIVDAAKRDFKKENDKVLWILVVVLAGIIGAAIYYFVIKKPDKH